MVGSHLHGTHKGRALNIRYATQISPFIQTFGEGNTLIIEFERFVSNRSETLREVSQFLGISFEAFSDYADVKSNTKDDERLDFRLDQPTMTQKETPEDRSCLLGPLGEAVFHSQAQGGG